VSPPSEWSPPNRTRSCPTTGAWSRTGPMTYPRLSNITIRPNEHARWRPPRPDGRPGRRHCPAPVSSSSELRYVPGSSWASTRVAASPSRTSFAASPGGRLQGAVLPRVRGLRHRRAFNFVTLDTVPENLVEAAGGSWRGTQRSLTLLSPTRGRVKTRRDLHHQRPLRPASELHPRELLRQGHRADQRQRRRVGSPRDRSPPAPSARGSSTGSEPSTTARAAIPSA